MAIVVSHYQITPLLAAWRAGQESVESSMDLERSQTVVGLGAMGIRFPNGELLTWDNAARVAGEKNACFEVREGTIERIRTFSELTNRPLSLFPTRGAPTMLVAGFPMHRIKGTDPLTATRSMVAALAPVTGRALDTATGLGYSAIELAKSGAEVDTLELDPAALEIVRQNPWSRELFANSHIQQRMGDSFELVPAIESNQFERVLHDPPTMALAGELYSEEIYRELFRVLKRGGKLFHYIGDPESKSGRSTTRGVVERLRHAGFARIARRELAFGVIAVKS